MARMDSLAEYTMELLEKLGPVQARRMFGGWGFYFGGRMFAVIIGGQFYLKADDVTKPDFQAAGCRPFLYEGGGRRVEMNFWTPPADAADDAYALLPWARRAVDAAQRAALKKAAKKKAPAKKAAAENAEAKKAPAEKAMAKKPSTEKAVAKKLPAEKAVARRTEKKAEAKQPVAKQPAAKQSAAKQSAAKQSAAKQQPVAKTPPARKQPAKAKAPRLKQARRPGAAARSR
ncbi:TfoX/Sxy family protein [Pyxidicoccus sp. 3LFB2]